MAQILEVLSAERCSAILRTKDAAFARPAMEAAIEGGFRVVEFTLTTPGALDLIRHFAAQEGVLVGAGTVLTPEDARRSVDAGAVFCVSPVVDPLVIETIVSLGAVAMPGVHTPTEMLLAYRSGAALQKVFPAMAGGASALRACLGPLPFLRLVPTNGVDEINIAEVMEAGAFGVGYVAPLFVPDLMARRDLDGIRHRARVLVNATRAAPRPEERPEARI